MLCKLLEKSIRPYFRNLYIDSVINIEPQLNEFIIYFIRQKFYSEFYNQFYYINRVMNKEKERINET